MIINKYAIDTNVLLYIHDRYAAKKKKIALQLLFDSPVISSQVISEYLNVARRHLGLPKDQLLDTCRKWLSLGNISKVEIGTLKVASRLIRKYDFQIFDSIIVASALTGSCHTLYSEDMQHNMIIEDTLQIVNPFV